MYKMLQDLCKERGTNITKLCESATGSSGNLSTWKKGYMRSDYLSKVADYLDCSVDYLLGRVDTPNDTYTINNQNTTVSGTQANVINHNATVPENTSDTLTEQFMQKFEELDFKDKVDIMKIVTDKIKNNE